MAINRNNHVRHNPGTVSAAQADSTNVQSTAGVDSSCKSFCFYWKTEDMFKMVGESILPGIYIYTYIYIIWNVIPNQSKLHMVSTDILPLKPNLCCLIASNCASSFHSTDQRVLKHQWARYSITLLGMTKKGMPYIAIPSSHCSRPSRIIIFSYSFGLVHHQFSMAGDAAVRSTSKEEAEKQSSAVPGHSDFRGVI